MIERRSFIAASVSAAIAASTRSVFASSTIRTRLEIEDFSNNDALVSALRTAVKKLRNSPMYPQIRRPGATGTTAVGCRRTFQ